jgi:hypothetical protein
MGRPAVELRSDWSVSLNERRRPVNLAEHIGSLKAKHAALDAAIHDEETRPLPDVARLHDLKRQKLKLKDEIEQMNQH